MARRHRREFYESDLFFVVMSLVLLFLYLTQRP